MANFKQFTRYTNGNTFINRSNKEFLVLRKNLKLEPGSSDIFIKITQQFIDRPDLIAQTAYNDIALWWAIYEFNNISDPYFDLKLEQILRIPDKDRLLEAISQLNKV